MFSCARTITPRLAQALRDAVAAPRGRPLPLQPRRSPTPAVTPASNPAPDCRRFGSQKREFSAHSAAPAGLNAVSPSSISLPTVGEGQVRQGWRPEQEGLFVAGRVGCA